jgi:hypothetical protein
MSSDLHSIKQFAAKILSTIRSKYPKSYEDTNKKEQLVHVIISKIDKYSKHINPNTAQQIINMIINEIITENHPEKKTIYPQRPSSNINDNYLLNPNANIKTNQNGKPNQVRFKNIDKTKPNPKSRRPNPNNMGSNSFVPVSRNVEQFNTNPVDTRHNDDDVLSPKSRFDKMMNDRENDQRRSRVRPPTPDFSLDDPVEIKIRRRKEDEDQRNINYNSSRSNQQSNINENENGNGNRNRNRNRNENSNCEDFTQNPQTQYGIIGSNELTSNNSNFSSFDNPDDGYSNINVMNIGIDPYDTRFTSDVSINSRYDEIKNSRNIIDQTIANETKNSNHKTRLNNNQSNNQSIER